MMIFKLLVDIFLLATSTSIINSRCLTCKTVWLKISKVIYIYDGFVQLLPSLYLDSK